MEAGQQAHPLLEAVLPYRLVAPATTRLDHHPLAGVTVEGLPASDAQAVEDNPATLIKTLKSQCALKYR